MVGLRLFTLLLLAASVGCSHMRAHMHPHVWPKSFNVPQKTAKGPVDAFRRPAEALLPEKPAAPPSPKKSEWKLVEKSAFSVRTFLLTVKDEQGRPVPSREAPEILLDGAADLLDVLPGDSAHQWRVRLSFSNDQAVVHVGFRQHGHTFDRFQRVHWLRHEVDPFNSNVYANKPRVRADGKDAARIYLHLKDARNFPVYRTSDYDVRLQVVQGKARVEGPFSSTTGMYFVLIPLKAGKVSAQLLLDGEQLGKQVEVSAESAASGRLPASVPSDVNACLEGIAAKAHLDVDASAPLEQEFARLGAGLVDAYGLLVTPSESDTDEYLALLSSPACIALPVLDKPREDFAQQLRQASLRARRQAESKGTPRTIWNAGVRKAQ